MSNEMVGPTIGFVGLGVMGNHMCRNLAEKTKTEVSVYDRNLDSVGLLGKSVSVNVCTSLRQLGESAKIVFLSLPNTKTVVDVCLGSDGLCSGSQLPRIIVDMGTTDVEETRRIGKELANNGVIFIDAPVARMPEAARDGTLLIMVGAEDQDYAEIVPYLNAMGTDIVRCGELGAGQVVKILNNFLLISNVNSMAEALLIGERSGVSGKSLFETIQLGSGSSEALKYAGLKGLVPRNFPQGRFSAAYALKDIELATQLANRSGVGADVMRNVRQRLERTVEHGKGNSYYPVLIDEIDVN